MTASELITELESAGVQLWEEGGQLHFRGPHGALTSERKAALAASKPLVLAELSRRKPLPGIAPDPAKRWEPFPLTDVQGAYLLGRNDAFGWGGTACHLYVELDVGAVDPPRLEAAWNVLITRHDMLRAIFRDDGSQLVLPKVPVYEIQVTDVRNDPDDRVQNALTAARTHLGHRVYDPRSWPLFDLHVTRATTRTVVHLSIDFIIADWASIELLLEELIQVYDGRAADLPTLDITFRDYVLAEGRLREGRQFERDRRYWLQRLPQLPPAPELPLARASAENADEPVRFLRRTLRLPPEHWRALRKGAAEHGLTPSGAVLAAYSEAIGRWSRRQSFTLNLTLLNRLPLHPDVPRLVGDFTSVNLLAVDTAPRASFAVRARALAEQLFADLDHRLFSGVEVLRQLARERGREAALMPVVFTSAIGLPRGRSRATLGHGITQTPQVFIDCQAMDRGDALLVNWDIRDGLFPEGVVDAMFSAFEALLLDLAASPTPWAEHAPVPLPSQQGTRRARANATGTPTPQSLLHEPVFAQAARTPGDVAVVCADRKLEYAELCSRANSVATWLRERGVAPGTIVAVVMEKGWEQVVAVLGVLLAGGAYLPVEATLPPKRRAQLVGAAGATLALTQSWIAREDIGIREMLDVDRAPLGGSFEPTRFVQPEDLAYVIFTSGSTGLPKGVMISHAAAFNTVHHVTRMFGVTGADKVLALSQLGFDLSVYDIFGPLSVGGSVVMPDPSRRTDPVHWADLVAANGVTLWNSVPAQLQMLADLLDSDPHRQLRSLRLALLSGDWIPLRLPDRARDRVRGLEVVSLGGATEAGIWSIYHRIGDVRPEWRSIPYGTPLPNQHFHVLDAHLQPCPEWTTGELYIGGAGLAQGYLGAPEQTAECFIVHPLTGERLYRTGDLGRYMDAGVIEFLGREDGQIKLRGHRIELGEIENALRAHPDVTDAAVIPLGTDSISRRLIAFVVGARGDRAPDASVLSRHLAGLLPEYMVPSQIRVLDELPLTDNQKLDRRALATAASGDKPAEAVEPPRTDLERRIAMLWSELLDVKNVGRNQSFFDLGGNSLLAARLAARMRETIPEAGSLFFDSLVRQLLPNPTIAGVAATLDQGASDANGTPRPTAPRSPLVRLPGKESGKTTLLLHDATGRVAPHRRLAGALAGRGPVVALVVNETAPYVRLAPDLLLQRRSASYVRLLKSHGHADVDIVGTGHASSLAFELARQLVESGARVRRLVLIAPRVYAGDVEGPEFERAYHSELDEDRIPPWSEVDAEHDAAARREVFRQTLMAARNQSAAPYLGAVTLVQPSAAAADDRWQGMCCGPLNQLVLDPHSEDAPAAITRALDQTPERGGNRA